MSQEPAFTGGRTPYLYSIASIYSTEHMRLQMKQHYLNVLHVCIQSGLYLNSFWMQWKFVSHINWPAQSNASCVLDRPGHDETRRRMHGDHHCKEKSMFKTDPEKSNAAANKQQRQRRSSDRAYSDVTLPKIVNRWYICIYYDL